MVFSPFRSAISHAPRSHKPTPDDPVPGRRPGTGRPHADAKVMQVRRLFETTTYSYAEIAKRTGVAPATISDWSKAGKWTRPLFAPRAADTVPHWRASLRLRRRTLSRRLHDLAERWVRELEAQPGVDFAKLREALELLKLTRLAERRHNPRHRPIEAGDPLATRAARPPRRSPISSRAARRGLIRTATWRSRSAGGIRSASGSMRGCWRGSEVQNKSPTPLCLLMTQDVRS